MLSKNVVVLDRKDLAAERKVVRPPCPFYGFEEKVDGMLTENNNACGLMGAYRPCAMQMAEKTPCWGKCWTYNTPEKLRKIMPLLTGIRIFPSEFRPTGLSAWDGVNLRGWFDLMTRK